MHEHATELKKELAQNMRSAETQKAEELVSKWKPEDTKL
jgi:hypothetical protein